MRRKKKPCASSGNKNSPTRDKILRPNVREWDEKRLWETYAMLTELEATFRSMKTELGLRPVYHQKEARVSAHLFITLLIEHSVHKERYEKFIGPLVYHPSPASWDEVMETISKMAGEWLR